MTRLQIKNRAKALVESESFSHTKMNCSDAGGSVYGSQNGFYGDSGREAQFSYDVNRVAQSQTAKVTNLYRSQNLAITEFTRLRRELTVNCSQSTPQITCSPYLPCLFNLKKDPCEEHNIALL